MGEKNVIVIGASAGGVPALEVVLAALPGDLDAAVFIALHLRPGIRSQLPEVLQRRSALLVAQAEQGEPIHHGRVYVARPDHHLIVEEDSVRNTRGPRENRARPSIDALFRSAAFAHGSRAIGVILSGALDDGTAGLWAIKDRGGRAVVQDPDDAEHDSMPRHALQYVTVDQIAPAQEIGAILVNLTRTFPTATTGVASKELELEARVALEGRALQLGLMELGTVTPYTCPECHGVLVALASGGIPRFRCHTGHAYSINSLLAEVSQGVEESLWDGIRGIEVSMLLLRQLAGQVRAAAPGNANLSAALEQLAGDAQRRADQVHEALRTHRSFTEDSARELINPRPPRRR
jgi:two-component system, chemotaxis family, protein-glutamate methylesterase/glutaminase